MTALRVEIESVAHGGAGVGRVNGKVVFCHDAVPGDVIEARVVKQKRSFSIAQTVEVVEPGPDRVEPPCPVFDRCGGCDWQMMSLAAQRRWKTAILSEQLSHLGRIEAPPVGEMVAVGPGFGYRNRVDLRVVEGRPALYERGSHRPVVIEDCPLVTEPISERIRALVPETGVDRITIRASEATGEAIILARRRGRWDDGILHEEVAGHRFRISGRAFFQVNTAGAAALVDLVGSALGAKIGDTLLDGYAGGGLFSATIGGAAGRVVAVENDRRALSDLAVNAPHAQVMAVPFERASLPPVDLAIVDPPRQGLGVENAGALAASGPRRIVYVSCDPASLARDIATLGRSGYRLVSATPVDMFPQTHHIESVSVLEPIR